MVSKCKEKQPLGPTNKNIWLQSRIEKLSECIADYVNYGDYETTLPWIDELKDRINEYNQC